MGLRLPAASHDARCHQGALTRIAAEPVDAHAVEAAGRSELDNKTIIIVMRDATLPLAEIKARLSEIVERVASRHERITLTRNGRPAAILISPDDLEALEDTLEILSNPQAIEEIEAARQEIARGEAVTGEQLRAKYLAG